jgi:hypothetical protein
VLAAGLSLIQHKDEIQKIKTSENEVANYSQYGFLLRNCLISISINLKH